MTDTQPMQPNDARADEVASPRETTIARMVGFSLFVTVLYGLYALGRAPTFCGGLNAAGQFDGILRDVTALVLLPIVIMVRDWRKPGFGWALLVPLATFGLYELLRNPCLLPFK